jgi:hypothetical protein
MPGGVEHLLCRAQSCNDVTCVDAGRRFYNLALGDNWFELQLDWPFGTVISNGIPYRCLLWAFSLRSLGSASELFG